MIKTSKVPVKTLCSNLFEYGLILWRNNVKLDLEGIGSLPVIYWG